MKRLQIAFLLLFILGCKPNPETYLDYINGYWEIESVTFPNGEKRDYTFSGTIDFIEINDGSKGFRKKLKPKLDGTFITSDDSENLLIVLENDSLNAYYQTPYAKWKETILFADETNLKVINQDKKVYLYKRYKPINLE